MKRHVLAVMCVGVILSLGLIAMPDQDAWAKDPYPAKAIDFVTVNAPGGGSDLMGRVVAERLKKEWKQPINIINRPGGGSVPCVESVMKAAPDGYTLLLDNQGTSSGNVIKKNYPFKLEERTFIARMAEVPMVLIIREDKPWKSLDDFKQALKGPGADKLIWGAITRESTGDFVLNQFFEAIDFNPAKLRAVFYNSSNPAAVAVAGKNADFAVVNTGTAMPFLKAGKIRILAITAPQRVALVPDVPTTRELGYPTVDNTLWVGLSGPPGLDQEVVSVVSKTVQKVLKEPELAAALRKIEADPAYLGPAEWKAFVLSHAEKVKKLLGTQK